MNNFIIALFCSHNFVTRIILNKNLGSAKMIEKCTKCPKEKPYVSLANKNRN